MTSLGYHAEGVAASQEGLLFTEELQGELSFSFCLVCSKG
jgi:hypothetical protein